MVWSSFGPSPHFFFMSIFYFCCLLDNIKILGVLFEFFFFFSYFFLCVKCVQQRCFLCKNVLKVNGCSSSLQNFLSMFFLKTFLSAPFFSRLTNLLWALCLLQLDPHESFWKFHEPRLYELLVDHFSALASFFPHLSRGDRLHFHKAHCNGNLFEKLSTYCNNHHH